MNPATGKAQKAKLLEHLGGLHNGRVDGCLTTFLHIIDHSFETIQARSGVLTIPSHAIPTNHPHVLSYPILSNQPSSSQSSFLSSQQPQPSPVSPHYRCRFRATTGPHQWKNCLHSQHPRAIPPDYRIEASQDDTSIEFSEDFCFFTDRTCKSNVFQLPPRSLMGNPGIYETLWGDVACQAVNSHDPMLELYALCLTPLYLRNL